MDAKKIIKKVYQWLPFKKQVFMSIKLLYSPPEKIYRHMYFNGNFVVKVNDDVKFKINHYGYQIENEIFWQGLKNGWEKVSINLWKELCLNSNTIVDVGANTGVYALIAKSINTNSNVFAFEPVHFTFDRLNENVQLNNFDIKTYELALSNFEGEANIFMPMNADLVYSVTVNKNLNNIQNEVKKVKINTTTLDNFIRKNNIQKIDLIKLDVETHEPEVLEGYKDFLHLHQPTMLIEILSDEVGKRVEDLLKDINYYYYNIDENNGIRKVEKISKSDYYNYLICKPDIAHQLNLI